MSEKYLHFVYFFYSRKKKKYFQIAKISQRDSKEFTRYFPTWQYGRSGSPGKWPTANGVVNRFAKKLGRILLLRFISILFFLFRLFSLFIVLSNK